MSNIKFGTPLFCTKTEEDVMFKVTSFYFDAKFMELHIVINYGLKVENIKLDINYAISLGLIDLTKLKQFTDVISK